jgi:hypothetical protein
MRMSMRRFTRLTNGFSKKLENHSAAVALHYMRYNFVRIHRTLRVTPAMAAGLTGRVWSIEEIVSLLEMAEKPAAQAGQFRLVVRESQHYAALGTSHARYPRTSRNLPRV